MDVAKLAESLDGLVYRDGEMYFVGLRSELLDQVGDIASAALAASTVQEV